MTIEVETNAALHILRAFKEYGEPFVMGQISKAYPDKFPAGTIFNLLGQPFHLVKYLSEEEMQELEKIRGPRVRDFKYHIMVSTD